MEIAMESPMGWIVAGVLWLVVVFAVVLLPGMLGLASYTWYEAVGICLIIAPIIYFIIRANGG